MKRRIDGWTIVIVGAWNRRIFTPPWLIQHLELSNEIELSLELGPASPFVYRDGNKLLRVRNDRVIVGTTSHTDESLTEMELLAARIVEKLPHTPMQGVGVNFKFLESSPPPALLSVFGISDSGALGAAGWEVSGAKLIRTLKKDQDLLNLSLEIIDSSKVEVECNFHSEVQDAPSALSAIRSNTIRRRNLAKSVLQEVYGLQEETT